MGQLALGVRSLVVRLAIFFVMAVLLAWALGGTLWPRPVYADAISYQADGQSWTWKARISSMAEPALTYSLHWQRGADNRVHREGWTDVCLFVAANGKVLTAARNPDRGWAILSLGPDGSVGVVRAAASRLKAETELLEQHDSPQ